MILNRVKASRLERGANAEVDAGSAPLRCGSVQGVIKSYDPVTGDGVLVNEADLADIDLADNALDGSLFRMLRQGQRVQFDLDDDGRATRLRIGSEVDMGTPEI